MKTFNFKALLLTLALCVGCGLAVQKKAGGSLAFHNYISYASWNKDSSTAVELVSADTLYLLDDSAGTGVPFTTASIGRNYSTVPGVYDRIPDSLGILIQAWGGIDAVSYEFILQYSINTNTGPWTAFGTPDTFTVADTARVINRPVARVFMPAAKVRGIIKPTTATDTVNIEEVRFLPLFR